MEDIPLEDVPISLDHFLEEDHLPYDVPLHAFDDFVPLHAFHDVPLEEMLVYEDIQLEVAPNHLTLEPTHLEISLEEVERILGLDSMYEEVLRTEPNDFQSSKERTNDPEAAH